MSRLYYDKPATGANTTSGQSGTKGYLEKVAKLIPSEILAAYMFGIGIIPTIENETIQYIGLIILFLAGLIWTLIYLNYMAETSKPRKIHLVISTFAFIIWSYYVSGHLVPDFYDPGFASLLLITFTIVSGKIPLN